MQRLRLLLVLAVTTAGPACGIDDLLIGAPCNEDADCPNLSCARTASQEASGEQGLCSEDGSCIPGEQEGCRTASDGSCELSLLSVEGPDGGRYCCGSGTNVAVVAVAEDGTAQCADCEPCDFEEEPCLAGEERCEVEEGAACGCRRPEADLLDESCGSDDDCGALVCVRTLEQLEEPGEATIPEQQVEPGNCRPSDDPTCAAGQRGCLVPQGVGCLSNSDTVVAVGTLEYCCPPSPDTNNFVMRIYDVSGDQGQAACTACARRSCFDAAGNDNVDACTTFSDPACEVDPGDLCGCPPAT